MKRRDFLKAGLAAGATMATRGALAVPKQVPAFELDEATIDELQQAMKSGKESSESITHKYLERIDAIDRAGPTLRSVIETNPEAMEIAARLDRERAAGRSRGPLHGIPILLKDNIETADRMATSAGSLALENYHAKRDAHLAHLLREAGAVILGKTNLSEWANFRSTHSSSGWSGRGGQTKNPYALDRNPCGSSSGSGVAASSSLCAAAVGTETDGSIVCPSTSCGIVGIKPTRGLVARSGIIPISHSQDTAGPMARTVRDAAILLGALAGRDPSEPTTGFVAWNAQLDPHQMGKPGLTGYRDYTQFLHSDGLKGMKIGIGRQFFGFSPRVDAIMEDVIRALKSLGATMVDPANMATKDKYDASELEVLLYEFKADLNSFLASRSAGPKSLADLIKFNEKDRDKEMPFFGQELFLQAEAKGPLSEKKYRDALAKNLRMSRKEGIDATMDQHHLDALLAPTGGPAWKTDLINGDHFSGGSSTPSAVSGYPAITVPAGFVKGLPVGVTFYGRAWSEPTLLKIAYAFEQATKIRKKPGFPTTAEGGRP